MTFGPGVPRPGATPLEHGFSYLGMQEDSRLGPNRGPLIDKWHRRMSIEPDPRKNPNVPKGGYPWCSSFACCMCEDGGRKLAVSSARVTTVWDGNQEYVVDEPEEGDLLVRLVPGETHIAFYIRTLKPGIYETLDGNSNEAGSRDGKDVVRKTRPKKHWQGIIRPPRPLLVS